jgi:ATP-dependent helicase/nuclease subunit A
MKFTSEQQAALDLRHNLVVRASAGTGKTTVLVERFVRLLLENPHWRINQVAAITYTRAAAAEMRNRVRIELLGRSQSDPAHAPRCNALLQTMDTAQITTIHGLCADILRLNAAQAGIDPAFTVLEESEALLLRNQAFELALETMTSDDRYQTLFEVLSPAGLKALLLNAQLLAQCSNSEWLTDPGQIEAEITALINVRFTAWQVGFLLLASPIVYAFDEGFDSDDKFTPTWRDLRALCKAIEAGAADEVWPLIGRIAATNLKVGSGKVWGDALLHLKGLVKQVQNVKDHFDAEKAALELHSQLAAQGLGALRQVRDVYEGLKRGLHALDFDDLERLTLVVLTDEDVRKRYRDGEIMHLMVDEFQDTNFTQFEIVRALVDLRQQGRLFIVGDEKQSIYRFRGAQVEVFEKAAQDVCAEGGMEIRIRQSQRSTAHLLAFFNRVFSQVFGSVGPMRYEHLLPPEQHVRVGHPQSVVRFRHAAKQRLSDYRRAEARLLADWIASQVGVQRVYDKAAGAERALSYGDIMLLFRSLRDVRLYEQALGAAGVPYVTVAGRGYFSRLEIDDVRNMLRALESPTNDLALASVLRSPFFGYSDDELLALRRAAIGTGEKKPLYAALEGTPTHEALAALAQLAGRVPVERLLREVFRVTYYRAVLTGLPDGARMRRNVEKIVSVARESQRSSLTEFLEYLDALDSVEVREGEAVLEAENSIKLMTFHASKGLEAPVVIVPDLGRRANITRSPGRFDFHHLMLSDSPLHASILYHEMKDTEKTAETEENRRLLYVALTRARDVLLLSDSGGTGSWAGDFLGLLKDESPDVHTSVVENTVPSRTGRAKPVVVHPVWPTPELIGPVPVVPGDQLRHMSATQLADLGTWHHDRENRGYARRRLVISLGQGTSDVVSDLDLAGRVPQRVVGEVVHTALRYWPLPYRLEAMPDQKLLRSYAWGHGVTDATDVEEVVVRALRLLDRFMSGHIPRLLSAAEEVYRELPVVYRHEGRVLHGVMDLLLRDFAGYTIVDYKSGYLTSANEMDAHQHAQRFHAQVGAYAEAVTAQFGRVPRVFVYYLSYDVMVEVAQAAWQTELARLGADIAAFIRKDEP